MNPLAAYLDALDSGDPDAIETAGEALASPDDPGDSIDLDDAPADPRVLMLALVQAFADDDRESAAEILGMLDDG